MGGEVRPGRREGVIGTRVERTANMACMVVTLEVSQLEMSALKLYML